MYTATAVFQMKSSDTMRKTQRIKDRAEEPLLLFIQYFDSDTFRMVETEKLNIHYLFTHFGYSVN